MGKIEIKMLNRPAQPKMKFSPVRFIGLRGDLKFYLNEKQHWQDLVGGWYEQQPSTFSFGGTPLTGPIEIRFDFRSFAK